MRLSVTEEIFASFPGALVGIAVAREIANAADDPAVRERLRRAQASAAESFRGVAIAEHPRRLLGEPEARPPRPGEVVYRDRAGAICRRWNWKEADRTKLSSATRNALVVVEGLPPISSREVEDAVDEIARSIREHCGGT